MSSRQLNSKTNDLVLLLKTIWRYWNYFLLPVATDSMDGNGFKLEKIGQFFSSFDATCSKNPQEIYHGWGFSFTEAFVYDLSLKVMSFSTELT